MDSVERSFPLTKLTAEVVTLTTQMERNNTATQIPLEVGRRQQSRLTRLMEGILRAFARSAEGSRYYYLTRSEKDPDSKEESETELDSCSL